MGANKSKYQKLVELEDCEVEVEQEPVQQESIQPDLIVFEEPDPFQNPISPEQEDAPVLIDLVGEFPPEDDQEQQDPQAPIANPQPDLIKL